MKNKLFKGLISIALLTVLFGCNKAPQTEIDAAKAAVTEAQASGADVYLTSEFNALNDSLNVVILSIEDKKSKWFASYNDEKAQLAKVSEQAVIVKENTEIRKNEIKEEILTNLESIKTMLAENQQLLTEAPKGKEGAAALVAIKDELTVLNNSVNDITRMVETGDFLNAQGKVSAVNEKTLAINTELKEAIAKTSKGRK